MSAVADATATSGGPIGRRMKRKEDPRLITGRGNYVDDISLPGMLYMALVRSPIAHGKITSIDTSGASGLDGVYSVITGEDLDVGAPLPMVWVPPGVEVKTPEHWPLARGEVNHVGDPVAAVVGGDKYAVIDAAEQIVVEYDELPAVVDPEKALERLADYGCDVVQGYLVSRPVPAAQLVTWLRARSTVHSPQSADHLA